jgi:hypothetical protein
LEASIFVVQMIRALDAMLFLASQTEAAAPADATGKPDADICADLDVFVHPGAQGDDTANALMASYVREFDVGDWRSVG